MYWLDLAIICALLWGGIAGYFQNLDKVLTRFMVVLLSIFMAHLNKNNFVALITSFSSIDKEINKVISSQLVIPVDGKGFHQGHSLKEIITELELPPVLYKGVIQKLELNFSNLEASTMGWHLTETLTEITTNVVGFLLALLVWGAWINLGRAVWLNRSPRFQLLRKTSVWSAFINIITNFFIVGLVSGMLGITTWLSPVLRQVMDINKSVFFNWSMQVYYWLGAW